jgi:hypothetical protein
MSDKSEFQISGNSAFLAFCRGCVQFISNVLERYLDSQQGLKCGFGLRNFIRQDNLQIRLIYDGNNMALNNEVDKLANATRLTASMNAIFKSMFALRGKRHSKLETLHGLHQLSEGLLDKKKASQ